MLKFGPKNWKQLNLSEKCETKIKLYKFLLSVPGALKKADINTSVWKYLLNFNLYYKAFSSLSRTRKLCSFTGRTRAVYRAFQLSRMKIRENIGNGMFWGISKSSW